MRHIDLYLRSHLPEAGKGSCLNPAGNTEAMNLHLAEIATLSHRDPMPSPDKAGWHLSERLMVPANVTIIPLPPIDTMLPRASNCCHPLGCRTKHRLE
jgi:hypothetical protein